MNELDSLRQEAETLKNAIRVSSCFLAPFSRLLITRKKFALDKYVHLCYSLRIKILFNWTKIQERTILYAEMIYLFYRAVWSTAVNIPTILYVTIKIIFIIGNVCEKAHYLQSIWVYWIKSISLNDALTHRLRSVAPNKDHPRDLFFVSFYMSRDLIEHIRLSLAPEIDPTRFYHVITC